MPGLIVFGRRWSVGSDDIVVPALLLVCLHVIWLTTLALIFTAVEFDLSIQCSRELKDVVLGHIVILLACIIVESVITIISLRGSILETKPRTSMQYLLYSRIVVFLGELSWLVMGIRWIVRHSFTCQPDPARRSVLGITIFNTCMISLFFISLWCTFDTAGRKWVKFKRYQESMKEKTQRSRRSGSARRNWRQRGQVHQYLYQSMQRKAMRAYEESWDRRLGLMCCCVDRKGRNKNSMSEIAQLFTEFFRDLDVVPSDVIAGLVLLRRFQKLRMQHTINQDVNDVYRYLSGIAVTPRTQFLQLSQPEVMDQYKQVIHYMKFAMAAYGWPIFMMMNTGTGLCRMVPYLRCCCCQVCCNKSGGSGSDYVLNDNCCQCNVVALKKISGLPDLDLVYVTYHVDIEETPFFVALDNKYKKIVICVRGTLSLQDVLTDLKADAETLPLDPVREDWVGHKGMVQAALYIKKKLKDDMILASAFQKAKERSSEKYDLVLVGHSLGAGAAAILAIMLQQEYQDVHCYAYSPPGGLLSYECMEATKSFITSVVIGKDVVPRIGLPQMELLRTDIINIIKKSTNPKWKIIMKALCCGSKSASQMTYDEMKEDIQRNATKHPSDEQIGLTAHKPMFPPGKIILVVRSHPGKKTRRCGESEPVYQAIWADNSDFQEVLVSPTMVNDHMPDNVLEALEKVLVNVAPPKPTRILTESERKALLKHDMSPSTPITPLIQNHIESEPLQSSTMVNNITSGPIDNAVTNDVTENNTTHPKEVCVMVNSDSGWDAATEELLLSFERQHLFPGTNEDLKHMLDLDSEWIHAPLATPEILSAASSMSGLSRTCSMSKGEQKSESMSARLEAIKQSPDMQTRSLSNTQGSVEDLQDQDSLDELDVIGGNATNNELGSEMAVRNSLRAGSITECKSIGDLLHQAALTTGEPPVLDISKGSMANLLPMEEYKNYYDSNKLSPKHLLANANACRALIAVETSLTKTKSSPELVMKAQDSAYNTSLAFENEISRGRAVQFDNDIDFSARGDWEDGDRTPYERHSPVETNQFGYANPNDLYSSASCGYIPNHSGVLYEPPSEEDLCDVENDNDTDTSSIAQTTVDSKPEVKNAMAGRSPDKRLHYSQSESRLKGLSDQFQMKRSTEEGDIAHLQDASKVFVGDKFKKILKQRDSEPAFDVNILPKLEIRLESVHEHGGTCNVGEQDSSISSPDIPSPVNHNEIPVEANLAKQVKDIDNASAPGPFKTKQKQQEISVNILTDNSECNDTSEFGEDTTATDKTCLIRKRNSSSDDERTYMSNNLSSKDSPGSVRSFSGRSGRSSPGRSPENEEDMRLFHSQSCHSTFTSGSSDQRLSLISANSEDFPIVETDV